MAELVDGVSKIDRIEFATLQHAQAENFRKMLLAMARDVRVILIKLADRLHNMRTLDAVPSEKQERIARETLDIYAPIANRLGLSALYYELEDLGFHYLHPNRFRVLDKALRKARGNRRDALGKIQGAIETRLAEFNVEAQVHGREKHISSIYKKMQEKNISFSEVFDIYGFRIIVPDVPASYLALGALHTLYKPIPGKFKDYIAIPKANGYQSLHTTLFGPFGMPIEIQIRTQEMHKVAEAGVASHWMYKSAEGDAKDVQLKTHQWLQSLLEIQSESGDALEFLEHIKVDLFPDDVYVFSPKGKIFALPKGATPIDFAYAVHTDVGNHCIAAKVDGEPVPHGHRASQRQPRRDPHRSPGASQSRVALVRRHRQGALAHPPLPEDHAAAGKRRGGRASAGAGAALAQGQSRRDRRAALDALLQGRCGQDARGGPRRHRPGQAPRGRRGEEAPLDRRARPMARRTSIPSPSAGPRASPCNSRSAAARFPATRSSRRSRRARASSCTRTIAPRSIRSTSIRRNGWTCSGTRRPTGSST